MRKKPGWRGVAAAVAVAVLTGLTAAPEARAQFFPPLGAAPPGEIAERLRAQGFVLTGPLIRRDTIYLVDVHGPAGRERLVLDAWSGAILQSFVSRGRNWRTGASPYVTGGGEFESPPPLGPPPTRDFFGAPGSFAAGAPPSGPVLLNPNRAPEAQQKQKRARAAKSKPAEAKAASAPVAPEPSGEPGSPTGGATPAAGAAPTPAAASAAPAAPAPAQPAAPVQPAATAQTPPKPLAPEKPSEPPAAAADKSGDKKVNDVPVNTLE
jgi:hypothetical protein